MKYIANVEIGGQLEEIHFETNENPVEHLWGQYGISCYIESLRKEETEIKED